LDLTLNHHLIALIMRVATGLRRITFHISLKKSHNTHEVIPMKSNQTPISKYPNNASNFLVELGKHRIQNIENMAKQEQEAARSHYLHYYSAMQRADLDDFCNKHQDWLVTFYIDSLRNVPFEQYREIELNEYQGAVLCNYKWHTGMNYARIRPLFPCRVQKFEKQSNPDDHSQYEPPLFQFFRDHNVEFKIWPVTEYQATIPEARHN
jgi:hypothetical protein